MKTQIDIYTGFLCSGKTSMIREFVKSRSHSKERVVVILCEWGEEEILEEDFPKGNVFIKKVSKDEIKEEFIEEIIKKHLPNRIIIEQNGMESVREFIKFIEKSNIRKKCFINSIINIVDLRTFDMLFKITSSSLTEQLDQSDLIIINHKGKGNIDSVKNTIKAINKWADIISVEEPKDYGSYLDEKVSDKRWFSKPSDVIVAVFLFMVFIYMIVVLNSWEDFSIKNVDFTWFEVFNTIFVSILVQALPFLLLGILISSFIQVFVSRDMIIKYFPQNKVASFIGAIIGGIFFPVCDCAIVPVAARLVKKGVPVYCAVTFMLAAPIVNPIVIASTLYAFPGQPWVAFYRVYLGISIAVASGISFLLFYGKEDNLLTGMERAFCGCSYCGDNEENGSIKEKFVSLFKHAGEEFFDVGRFLVIGAFITSVFQVAIPKDMLLQLGDSKILSLIIMMFGAVILSVCSSSDAFIARGFTNQFPIGGVMGFLVLGPMIDIKNILLMLGSFNKKFIWTFLVVVSIISFIMLFIFATTF